MSPIYKENNFLSQHHQTLYSVESDIKARLKYRPEIIYIHITRLTDGWWLVLRPVNGKEVILVLQKPWDPIFYRLGVSRVKYSYTSITKSISRAQKALLYFLFLVCVSRGASASMVNASCLVNGPGNRWKGSSDCYHALHQCFQLG